MAFGSTAERLAFILELDTRSGEAALKRFGDTADRELGRADDRLDRVGGRMQVAGAGAIAFAGVAGAALMGFARASEEANLATVRLQNSIDNSPELAGESADRFLDLADAIQAVTAADGDAIVAAQAMLGTFHLTGDEIRNVTPFVVDYARKFGVDLVDAATQVGKAFDGNSGALRRNGVSIDLALFATDRYAAVTQALREQVGGFAEQEGATFSGQMERLKNQLADVAEGIGVGVVSAFNDLLGPVQGATTAFGNLDPKLQSSVGRIATFGTLAIGAAGALSVVGGSVLKARDNFSRMADAINLSANATTRLKTGLGVLGIAGVTLALLDMSSALGDLQGGVDELVGSTDQALVETFRGWQDVARDTETEFRGSLPSAFEPLERFRDLAEENIGTAQRLRDALAAEGDSVADLDVVLREVGAANRRVAIDQAAATDAIEDGTGATDRSTEAIRRNRDAAEQSRRAFERLREARDAATGNAISAERADINLQRAQQRLAEANADGEASALDRREAELDVQEAVIALGEAWEQLAEDQAVAADEGATAVRQAADAEIAALQSVADKLAPGADLRRFLDSYIAQLMWLRDNPNIETRIMLEGIAAGDHPGVLSTEGQPAFGSPSFPIPASKSASPVNVTVNGVGHLEVAREIEQSVLWAIGSS